MFHALNATFRVAQDFTQRSLTLAERTPKARTRTASPLRNAAYTDRFFSELSVHGGDAFLGICYGGGHGRGRWLRRQLKHHRLLTLT